MTRSLLTAALCATALPVCADPSVVADAHAEYIYQIDFSSDGKLMATAAVGDDRSLRLLDLPHLTERWSKELSDYPLYALAYHPVTKAPAVVAYASDDFPVSYAYADRVERIFGVTAPNAHPLRDFEGDFHFFDLSGKTSIGKIGGYAYLIDIDTTESFPNFPVRSIGDTNTFGLFWQNNGFHAEFAYQDGDAPLRPNINGEYDAVYGHFKYSTELAGLPVNMGVEYLGDGFVTPLATVHAFNGFADSFIFNRIGLPFGNAGYEGLTDIYSDITKTGLPGGLVFKGFLHYYMDDELDANYGWEADMVLLKKLNDNATAIFKAAYFEANDFFNDITQVSLQVAYRF